MELSQQVKRNISSNLFKAFLVENISFWKDRRIKFLHFEVDRKEKQLRGETAARQQLELQLDRLANQVFVFLV